MTLVEVEVTVKNITWVKVLKYVIFIVLKYKKYIFLILNVLESKSTNR